MKIKRTLFLHPQSIILRLLLSFLLLMLPLEIAGLFFLSWSKEQIQEEIEASSQVSIHYLTQNFEVNLSDLSSHLARLVSNNLFAQFTINHDHFSTSEYYTNLQDQYNLLRNYPNIYPMLEDIKVYYPSIHAVMSATNAFIKIQDNTLTQAMDDMRTSDTLIKGSDNSLFLSMLYPVSTTYTQSVPMFFITMELSNEAIIDYLDTSSQNYDTAFYLHTQKETICSSTIKDPTLYSSYIEQIDRLVRENPQDTAFTLSDSQYYIIAEYSPYLQCSFLQFIPLKQAFRVPDKISQFLLIYSLLSMPIICIFCYIIFKLIVRPMESLMNGYRHVEEGDYTTSLPEDTSSQEFRLLIRSFNKMTFHLHQAIDQLYNYRIYTQKMELKQLQMQMNPHFLYNTYFILHRLIKYENIEQAMELSTYLGNYFQYITRNASDMVPLKKEWDHAENYLKIQEIRYSIRVQLLYDPLPVQYDNFMVPRLILQPLLENALEHGMKEIQENGIVAVHFADHSNHIEILVSDNGNTLSEEDIHRLEADIHSLVSPDKEFTALRNIHRRLQLTYGENAKLTLTPNPGGGLCVHILIPIKGE